MGLSSIQSIGKDLAETAVMAPWIAPDTYPVGNNLTILENLCPPRADSLLIGGLFAGTHKLLARAFHVRDKSEKMQFVFTVFSGLTSVGILSILPIQTDGFVEPYYDSVLKLVGIVAIRNIATDLLKRCLDSKEEVQPHKVYNYVAIGAVAGIAMHFYAFTGACYFSQMLFSDWMTGFGVLPPLEWQRKIGSVIGISIITALVGTIATRCFASKPQTEVKKEKELLHHHQRGSAAVDKGLVWEKTNNGWKLVG